MNILFVGLGRISQRYLRIIKKYHKKKINNIYVLRHSTNSQVIKDDLSSFEAKDICKYYNIVQIKKSDIKSLNLRAAFIVNAPSKMRINLIIELLKYKIHIFCEKPILPFYNINESEKIKSLIIKNNIIFFSAFQLRYHIFFNKIKDIINKNKFGKLKFIKMEISESFHLFNKYTSLKKSHYVKKNHGGGVILAQCHEIDILHYLLDTIKVINVIKPSKPFLKNLDVDMLVNILFEGKKLNNIFPIQLHMDMLNPIPTRQGTFFFENHLVSYDLRTNTSSIYDFNKNKLSKEKYNFERIDLFKKEISDFFLIIDKSNIIFTNFEEGLKSLKTIKKIKEKL